jgi:hypothetical protein
VSLSLSHIAPAPALTNSTPEPPLIAALMPRSSPHAVPLATVNVFGPMPIPNERLPSMYAVEDEARVVTLPFRVSVPVPVVT